MISDPSLGDTVFVLETTGYVKSVGFHAREGQAPFGPTILNPARTTAKLLGKHRSRPSLTESPYAPANMGE